VTTQQRSDHPAPAILVIDDEDYVADMLASALEIEHYTVHLAYNGRQGWDLVQSITPDLIIIDLMMPYLNGEALAAQIRADPRLARVPIILMSAGARPSKLVPITTFVAKPFDLFQMLALIDTKIGSGDRPAEGKQSQQP